MNFDNAIDSFLSPIADKISGIIFCSININGVEVQLLVALLMTAALYFTFRTGFIGIWGFKHAIKLITKNYEHKDVIKRKKKGEVSSFQALTATISLQKFFWGLNSDKLIRTELLTAVLCIIFKTGLKIINYSVNLPPIFQKFMHSAVFLQ